MLVNPGSVLIIEDTPSLAYLFKSFLEKDAHKVTIAETGADGLIALEQGAFDLILLDLLLPDMDGFDVMRTLIKKGVTAPVIVSTADGSAERAIEAMRIGAVDFLVKPFDEARLMVTVRNALDRDRLSSEVTELKESIAPRDFEGFVGSSPAMRAIFATIDNVAASKATVFITGESGTGKEVAAEAIHKAGRGPNKPFVAVNCGAIPDNLFESELFGHKKGSFTGAISDHDGAARRASGGTLFLDEICEMDLALQTKLLRFLQTSTVQPVGGGHPEKVDVRIVCATNRDPMEEVRAGRFREDLYYRLNVIPLDMPPLRARGEDILALAEHFLARYGADEGKTFEGFTDDAKAALMSRYWSGNVRELQNSVRQVAVMTPTGWVSADHLPQSSAAPASASMPTHEDQRSIEVSVGTPLSAMEGTLAEIEQQVIEDRIKGYGGSVGQAAASLGISPSTIYRKREAWSASSAALSISHGS